MDAAGAMRRRGDVVGKPRRWVGAIDGGARGGVDVGMETTARTRCWRRRRGTGAMDGRDD